MKPKRIQRKRTKGWRMPENTVYVGRPTKWGNPYYVLKARCGCCSVGDCMHGLLGCATPKEAVGNFSDWIKESPKQTIVNEARQELRGKNLACWCALNEPCHADVLLKIANEVKR